MPYYETMKVKSCPFCGADNTILVSAHLSTVWASHIECQNCQTRGPLAYHAYYDNEQAKEQAITLWNNRVA